MVDDLMTLMLEIPEELANRLGPMADRLSREALALEALRQGLWTEAELGGFLGLGRIAREQFLKVHGVALDYSWEDLEQERALLRTLEKS